jgi:hypothetical protein
VNVDLDFINLSWTTNENIIIVRNQSGYAGYPQNFTNGTLIYNGTGPYYVDSPLSVFTKYYYTIWTYNQTTHLFSDPLYINATTSPTSLNIEVSPATMDYGEVIIGTYVKTTNNHFNLTNIGMGCNVDIECSDTENWTYVNISDIGHDLFSMNWSADNWTSEYNIKTTGTNMVMDLSYGEKLPFDLKYILPLSTNKLAKQNTIMTFTVTPS